MTDFSASVTFIHPRQRPDGVEGGSTRTVKAALVIPGAFETFVALRVWAAERARGLYLHDEMRSVLTRGGWLAGMVRLLWEGLDGSQRSYWWTVERESGPEATTIFVSGTEEQAHKYRYLSLESLAAHVMDVPYAGAHRGQYDVRQAQAVALRDLVEAETLLRTPGPERPECWRTVWTGGGVRECWVQVTTSRMTLTGRRLMVKLAVDVQALGPAVLVGTSHGAVDEHLREDLGAVPVFGRRHAVPASTTES